MLLGTAAPVASSKLALASGSRRLYHAVVPQRSVIQASGRDARKLLQNLTTNDIFKIDRAQFTGFLTPQGRMIATAFMYSLPDEESLLIDVDTTLLPAVLDCIKRFKLRSKVTVSDVTDELAVMAHWDGDSAPENSVGSGADPRTPEMGFRSIVQRTDSVATDSGKAYAIHRILQGVAESGAELAGLPLEANLDLMHGIDFRKGCYLGQELTARTHHTGVVRKRIVPVSVYRDASRPPDALQHEEGDKAVEAAATLSGCDVRGMPLTDGAKDDTTDTPVVPRRGRSAGKLLSHVDNVGLAMLRLEQVDRWNKDMLFRVQTSGDDGGGDGEAVYIRPWIPSWWPSNVMQSQSQSQKE